MTETTDRWYGRAFFYELAHVVFSGEPDENLLAVLASEDCRATLEALAGECAAVAPLAAYAATLPDDADARVAEAERCRIAYNRAVAGLGARRTSHPWESAYTSSKKLLMQRETLAVREAYRAFGYLPEMYRQVPDDHLSLECAFLAALAQKSVAALEAADVPIAALEAADAPTAALEADGAPSLAGLVEGQRAFLADHLLKWIDAYAADLHADVPDTLYDYAATALAAYAEADAVFLSECSA